jgi:hypothetical protein
MLPSKLGGRHEAARVHHDSRWRGTAAAAHAREVLQREPTFTVENYLGTLHYQQPSDTEHLREGLVKAGLPS